MSQPQAKANDKIVHGEDFMIERVQVSQDRISSEKCRELLDPATLKQVMNTISFEQMKTTRVKGAKPDFKMPNFANATVPGLVDQLGAIREQQKLLEKEEGLIKEALKARIKAQ